MKSLILVAAIGLAACGCGNKSNSGASATPAAPAHRIYDTDAVSKDLSAAGVVISTGARQDVQAFFAAHSDYQVCTDSDAFSVAVVRNAKYDPKADDIYIVASYRDGKIASLDIGPPQFSAANLTSYCR